MLVTMVLGADAWVTASQLNVRAEPSKEAKLLVRLRINSKVAVLEQPGPEWTKVELGDKRVGFVASAMLAKEKLTAQRALSEAKAAPDLAQRLAWLERAAAIEPGRETLKALAEAVRASGDEKRAALLESRLPWPDDLFVSPDFDPKAVHVEWPGPLPANAPKRPGSEVPVELAMLGVKNDEPWWVLPSRGRAVKAKAKSAVYRVLNECGGEYGVWLTLDAKLPTGEVPVAIARRAVPPAGWDQELPAVDLAAAKKLARAQLDALGAPQNAELAAGADLDGAALVRAWWLPKEEEKKEWFEQRNDVVELRVEHGAASVKGRKRGTYMPPNALVVRRDIDGDGKPDLVLHDRCCGRVADDGADLDGPARTQTTSRCCGC